MDRHTERDLIERAIAGDRAAAGEFIQAHQASVYAYLLRMSGRPHLAEDIAQEAFVRVLSNLDRFDFRYRFSTWLFTIARRLYLNAVQKHKPAFDSEVVSRATGDACMAGGAVDDDESRQTRRDLLQQGLMRLSTEQREIIVLFHQLDWPIALISRHLGMPEGTVKSHLHRGRQKLRKALAETPDYAERLDLVSLGLETHTARDEGVPD
ncbi:MAG: sigma-70 family RNA polymerase sigma factor [Phycisphaeraceae bacterium]|nr:MAG: sigma-70 family RNA polymerase sigma factor [Phycisphaeraceae bacterium]